MASYEMLERCDHCGGEGLDPGEFDSIECEACEGLGILEEVACDVCGGLGCPRCADTGFLNDVECPHCETMGIVHKPVVCPVCNGKKTVVASKFMV